MPSGYKQRAKISKIQRKRFLGMVARGYSVRMASQTIGHTREAFFHLVKINKTFKKEYENARDLGRLELADDIYNAMREGIKAGQPWFVRMALANFDFGLVAPDLYEKKQLQKVEAETAPEQITISVAGVRNQDGQVIIDDQLKLADGEDITETERIA